MSIFELLLEIFEDSFDIDLVSRSETSLLVTDDGHQIGVGTFGSVQWKGMGQGNEDLGPEKLGTYKMGVNDVGTTVAMFETGSVRTQ